MLGKDMNHLLVKLIIAATSYWFNSYWSFGSTGPLTYNSAKNQNSRKILNFI